MFARPKGYFVIICGLPFSLNSLSKPQTSPRPKSKLPTFRELWAARTCFLPGRVKHFCGASIHQSCWWILWFWTRPIRLCESCSFTSISILMDMTVLVYEALRTSLTSRIMPRRTRSVEVVAFYWTCQSSHCKNRPCKLCESCSVSRSILMDTMVLYEALQTLRTSRISPMRTVGFYCTCSLCSFLLSWAQKRIQKLIWLLVNLETLLVVWIHSIYSPGLFCLELWIKFVAGSPMGM
jgi:hypothetical protein